MREVNREMAMNEAAGLTLFFEVSARSREAEGSMSKREPELYPGQPQSGVRIDLRGVSPGTN